MSADIDRDAIDIAPVVQAAGSLPWRVKDGELQVQLIHRPRYNDWSWPKGRLNKGEPQPVGAVRETAEETGKPVSLGIPLPGLQYLLADGRVKRVHYWAATRAPKSAPVVAARFPVPAVDPDEIDGRKWLSVAEALERLTRRADQIPLKELISAHESGHLRTRPLIIARHGKAIDRSSWDGDEATRPLTPFGSGQADALTQLLAAFDVTRVLTSPWRRCAATVEPFATATGLTPEAAPELTEHAHERSRKSVRALVENLVADAPGAVLCTHRPVLPTIFEVLRESARPKVARALPKATPYLQPGGCLVAHIADTAKGPRIVAFERFKPTLW
ncbi:NUDIX hydrolase [Rarobacter faecitabidus]|nr:histidine phosphatase family protein [Rarobacter faecitabidus]